MVQMSKTVERIITSPAQCSYLYQERLESCAPGPKFTKGEAIQASPSLGSRQQPIPTFSQIQKRARSRYIQ
jgi:hypothetical protein